LYIPPLLYKTLKKEGDMKRTAEMALANLEMRTAKLEEAEYQEWVDMDFKTTSRSFESGSQKDLKATIFQLNPGYDFDLPLSGKGMKSIVTSLFRPLKRIIEVLEKSGMSFKVVFKIRPTLIKKSGSEEVTLTFENFFLCIYSSPFKVWQDPNDVEANFDYKARRFYATAPPSLNHSLEWLNKKQDWKITYNPIRGTLNSNIPLLLKASFAKALSKHLKDYQENRKLISKAIHEKIASWSEDFVKGYSVEKFDMLVEEYAEDNYRRPHEDEDWHEYGGRESAVEHVWENVVLADKKVSGLEGDPKRPVFLFLIDFDDTKNTAALVRWDFTSLSSRDVKWGTLEKMRSLYNKS